MSAKNDWLQPQPIELDVRLIPHDRRHDIIFTCLEHLKQDQQLQLIVDHDPLPLRYQTEALWPGQYTWKYLQAGPSVWRLTVERSDTGA